MFDDIVEVVGNIGVIVFPAPLVRDGDCECGGVRIFPRTKVRDRDCDLDAYV